MARSKLPSKTDLLRLLSRRQHFEPDWLVKLDEAVDASRKEMNQFLENNVAYQKLTKNHNKACEKYRQALDKWSSDLNEQLASLRELIWVNGVTEDIVKAVKKFLEELK